MFLRLFPCEFYHHFKYLSFIFPWRRNREMGHIPHHLGCKISLSLFWNRGKIFHVSFLLYLISFLYKECISSLIKIQTKLQIIDLLKVHPPSLISFLLIKIIVWCVSLHFTLLFCIRNGIRYYFLGFCCLFWETFWIFLDKLLYMLQVASLLHRQ